MHHHQRDLHIMAAAGRHRGQCYSAAMPAPPDQGYTSINTARQHPGPVQLRQRRAHRRQSHSTQQRAAAGSSSGSGTGPSSPAGSRRRSKCPPRCSTTPPATGISPSTAGERTPAGTLNPDRPDFAEDSRQIRGLIDDLFRRDADKQQAAALWAAGLGARNFTREYLQ